MRRRPNKDSVHGHPGHGNRGQRHGSQGHSGHGYGGQEHGSHGHEGHGLGGQGHSRHGHDDHGHVGHGHYGKKTQHGNEAPEGLAEEAKSQRTPEELARRTIVKKVMDKCTQWWERAVEMLPERLRYCMQPSHFLMILAVGMVSVSIIENSAKMVYKFDIDIVVVKPKSIVNFIYLTSFCLLMGSQYWMTIVSGLSLYFNLSKHTFGEVQKILFPRYFSSNSVLSGIVLSQFIKIYGTLNEWNFYTSLQFLALCLSFLLALSIRLYLVPPLLGIMSAKMAIERAAGVGTRIGRSDIGRLADCPHYITINRTFRLIHTCMAGGNVVTIICTVIHLMYMISCPDTAVRG